MQLGSRNYRVEVKRTAALAVTLFLLYSWFFITPWSKWALLGTPIRQGDISNGEPFRSAIIYLVRNEASKDLSLSLKLLNKNFNRFFNHPVFLVAEKPWHDNETQPLRVAAYPMPLTFLHVPEFHDVPDNIPEDHLGVLEFCDIRFPLGYRKMCRFWSRSIFSLPQFRNITIYMRLDTDSYIFSPIRYDIISYAFRKDVAMLFHPEAEEALCVAENLWRTVVEFARDYQDEVNVEDLVDGFMNQTVNTERVTRPVDLRNNETFEKVVKNGYNLKMFYNNFEIIRMKHFRTALYEKFMDKIDDAKGIFTERWGDAPIRTLTTAMFSPRGSRRNGMEVEGWVEPIQRFLYYHQGPFFPSLYLEDIGYASVLALVMAGFCFFYKRQITFIRFIFIALLLIGSQLLYYMFLDFMLKAIYH